MESLPRGVEAVIAVMFQHLVESLPRRVEAVIAVMFHHLVEKPSQKSGGWYSSKGGTNSRSIAQDCGMRFPTIGVHILLVM
jgi:hypothetical protein